MRKPILIVDDEPIVQESIKECLNDAGYQAVTTDSDEEALQLIKGQDFSIIVLDIRWPGEIGLMALKKMRALKPQSKFIVVTAYPSPDLAIKAMKLGIVDYLSKPIAPDDLERLIRETFLKCESEQ